jgi:DNA-binding response OmpR family regulator
MAHTVLVVDDEEIIRDLIGTVLLEEGYEVLEAGGGEEAIELARKQKPDVILLDIRMPGIDGIHTCRRLKRDQETKDIPVIMVTGMRHGLPEAMEAGAFDFITKPFDTEELGIRVKAALRIRNLSDQLESAVAYIQELEEHLANL